MRRVSTSPAPRLSSSARDQRDHDNSAPTSRDDLVPNERSREEETTTMNLAARLSKRERLRQFFDRSPSPLPIRSTAASAQAPPQGPAYTRNTSSILADALEALDREGREAMNTLLLANTISIDTALDEVLGCARELQQRCANKRWVWEYKGRQIYLFDQADKVMQLLNKFKSVGDVVANVDPVHVGLPWAGVRAILEVCIGPRNVSFWLH